MPESFLLDPTSENTGTQLDISVDPYGVSAFSSPAPPLETATSGSIDTEGDAINARRHQNRQVSLTVEVTGTSQTNLDANVATLEAKVAKLAREGGTFRRVRTDGAFRTLDILAADSYEKTFDLTYLLGNLAVCQINLIAEPYARGAVVSAGTFSETTKAALVFTVTGVTGDIPAIGQLSITDAQAVAQYWATWGLRSQYYSASSPLYYEGESATLATGVTASAFTGASGGSAAVASLMSGLGADGKLLSITSAGALSLIGTFRVYARVYSGTTFSAGAFTSGSSPLTLALKWRALPNNLPTTNTGVVVPLVASQQARVIDLGLVSFPVATLGTQASDAAIHVTAFSANSQGVAVDAVWFMPITEGSGQATGNVATSVPAVNVSKSLVVGSSGVLTQTGTTQYSNVPVYEGDYLKVPVAGSEGRTSQFIVKATRLVPNTGVDSLDDVSATLSYTPRYLSLT